MKTISRYIMTLALLLTAVTGAWADETPLVTIESKDYTTFKSGSMTFDDKVTVTFSDGVNNDGDSYGWGISDPNATPVTMTVTAAEGYTINSVKLTTYNGTLTDTEAPFVATLYGSSWYPKTTISDQANGIWGGVAKIEVYGTDAPTVAWNASTKSGTFAMPGSDVVLTPIYAKAAAFATTGTGSEVKTLLPEAAEGVIADTDDPLIKEGTGIVAFAGESTTVTQGTLMYAVTPATVTEAPALDAANKWSATVPTAKTVADGGIDVLVWYYIQGADAPDGEAATLDNTFNDTEPACLTVQVLSNKFDIQFNAANANTIEAGKATVTVGGAAATVTDGKLEGVKMGSEVKLEAKPGYKFRKVEVKKKETPSLSLTNPTVGQVIGSDGKNYAAANVPSGVDKVAMIAYVSGSNGLAIALADEGSLNWATAKSTCEAKTPAFANGTWKLPTQDEWKQMFSANGGSEGSYTGLNTAITTAGGTILQELAYWSSTPNDGTHAYGASFYSGLVMWSSTESKNKAYQVRAVLAF